MKSVFSSVMMLVIGGCDGSETGTNVVGSDGAVDLSPDLVGSDGGADLLDAPDLNPATACDPFTNQGCPANLKCTGIEHGTDLVLGCGSKGTKKQGDACTRTPMGDDCADHYVCIQLPDDANPICRQFCKTNAGCPTVGIGPSACQIPATSLPKLCDEVKPCNPLDPTSCPAYDGCYVTSAAGGQCWPVGTLSSGETCNDVDDCAGGFVCSGGDIDGYKCRQICNTIAGAPSCTDGICAPLSDAPVGVGNCVPRCNPLDQTSCPAYDGCYGTNIGDICLPAGTVASGQTCMYVDDCMRGFTCASGFDGYKCRQICNTGTPACIGGVCTPLSGEPVGVGVCEALLPESDCFDGIDNNGDSLADCQDPTCTAKATCVPVVPATETGIIHPGPCAGDYGATEVLHQGLSADSCAGSCDCSVDVTCQCSGTLYYGGGANTCGGSTVDIGQTQDVFHASPPSNACTNVAARAYEAAVFTTNPTPVSNQLNPYGSATMNTPTWTTTTNFCSSTKSSMTCADSQHQCVPKPQSGSVCIKVPNQTDTAQCPAGYTGTTGSYFVDFTKGSCQCGSAALTNTPACIGNEYLTFATADCQGVDIVGYSECSGTCCSDLIYNSPPGNPPFKMDTKIIAAVENYFCVGSGSCSSSLVVATATTKNGASIVCCE